MKLVIAVDLPAHLAIHLQGLRDSLNDRLRGRIALADVSSVVLIDYARLVANPMFSAFIKTAVVWNMPINRRHVNFLRFFNTLPGYIHATNMSRQMSRPKSACMRQPRRM